MDKKYNPKKIEAKWQGYWEEKRLNRAVDNEKKRSKFYCLDMFPYPSAEGLHVGHVEGYTATDIYSRYLRMNGYNVLHPMGWDSFGLPAENYAIKTNKHPKQTIKRNISRYKKQLKSLGFSYDWDREINTADPKYYKWSQWFFLFLYKKGLAYRKKAPVNWCESCRTVLANEQVVEGRCERCKNKVVQKELDQWFFKITDYADRLLKDLADLDWSDSLKTMQKNWIGRSEGVIIEFKIKDSNLKVDVFTTRPDTLFGATYLVLAPEHPIVASLLKSNLKIPNHQEVQNYIKKTKEKTELERIEEDKIKTGVELKGVKAINPANKKEIPIFIGDYVLISYGTGAIMCVPAHDQRDFEFAKRFNLPIRQVIVSDSGEKNDKPQQLKQAYTGRGTMINSGRFNGMDSEKAKEAITELVAGQKSTQYKLRDWLISRQRYWGAPIPIIYCPKCGEEQVSKSQNQALREGIDYTIIDNKRYAIVPVPEEDLPVTLPDDVDFRPKGKSPLAYSKKFQKVKCPRCGSTARRETDTMDGFVDNSWYYYRFCDPQNSKHFASSAKVNYWMPIDLYVGGAEHAVGHLLYSRFFTKVLYDNGYIKFSEPFKKLINQGLILASDGRKMSKSLGNVINPDEVVRQYGADTLRMYEMFMGPLEESKPWDTKGIIGIQRFLDRVWKFHLMSDYEKNNDDDLHNTIKKVTEDIQNLKFNTAISAMMIYINLALNNKTKINKYCKEQFIKILAPFAPHIAEEMWFNLGHNKSVFLEKWPDYKRIKDEKTTIAVQINGKVRAVLTISFAMEKEELISLALKNDKVKHWLKDQKIKKIIYVPNKILSIVI